MVKFLQSKSSEATPIGGGERGCILVTPEIVFNVEEERRKERKDRIQLTISEQQATGLERFELLGKLEGVDVFDMKPMEMTRIGTVQDPIPIYSLVSHLRL